MNIKTVEGKCMICGHHHTISNGMCETCGTFVKELGAVNAQLVAAEAERDDALDRLAEAEEKRDTALEAERDDARARLTEDLQFRCPVCGAQFPRQSQGKPPLEIIIPRHSVYLDMVVGGSPICEGSGQVTTLSGNVYTNIRWTLPEKGGSEPTE